MKLIDRDELLATLEQDIDVSVTGEENMEAAKRCLQEILDDVKGSPVVDAVPVVRCRDCKWYEEDIGCDWGVCFHDDWTHRDVGHGVDGDGYCYRAEKK